MPAVAVAVSSESVSCSTVNQFKVYMSAMFENRKSKNSTPSRRTRGYIPSSNFRTATPRERLSMPAVAVAVSSESVSCSTVNQLKVYMSAMFENRRSKNSTPSRRTRGYIPSNFRTATPRERLSTPAVAMAVSSKSVSCSTVVQLKVYISAIFEIKAKKLYAKDGSAKFTFQFSKQRRSKNFRRCCRRRSRLSMAAALLPLPRSAAGRTVDRRTHKLSRRRNAPSISELSDR